MTGPKSGGSFTRIAPGSYAASIVADEDAVYWSVSEEGIKRWSKTSHEIMPVADGRSEGGPGSHHLEADDRFLYWNSSRGIERIPKAGGASTLLHPKGELSIDTIHVTDGCVYFSSHGKLYRMPKTGGEPVVLATTALLSLFWFAVDGTAAYWTEWEGDAPGRVMTLPFR
jgi:hypothetical protein